MADKELNVRIKLKRDTDANWRAKDPQLLAGEVVFVDTNAGEVRTKVGDGTKKYSALPFSDEAVRNLISDSSKPAFYFQGTLSGSTFTPTSTVADLNTAYEAGRPCFCSFPASSDTFSATATLQLIAFNKSIAYLFAGVVQLSTTPVYYQVWSINGGTSWLYMSRDLATTDSIPTVPTKISAFTNDAKYLTSTSASSTYVAKTGDETIKGIKTFESVIKDSAVPTDNTHLTNKKYVDEKIASAVQEATSGGITETVGNTKYLRIDGTNSPTAGINFNGQNLEGVNLLSVNEALGKFYTPCGTDYLGIDTFTTSDDNQLPILDLALYTSDSNGNFNLKDENDPVMNYQYGIYGGACASTIDGSITTLNEGFFINENIFNAMQRPLHMDGHTIGYTQGIWVGAPDRAGKYQCFISAGDEKSIKFNILNDDTLAEYENELDAIDSSAFTTDQVRLMNVATPVANTDAVNKAYVDNAIPTIPTSLRNPYALTVKGAVSATYDGSSAISITIPNAGISQTDADNRYLQLSGGTITGNLNVSGLLQNCIIDYPNMGLRIYNEETTSQRRLAIYATTEGLPIAINGVDAPIMGKDVANKDYVDSAISTATASYLPLAGGKMTGTINVNNQSLTSVGKLSFLRGVYLQNSNVQQSNVLYVGTSSGSPAYISAYATTPTESSNANVIANKAYVDTKTVVTLKTWTSADVS